MLSQHEIKLLLSFFCCSKLILIWWFVYLFMVEESIARTEFIDGCVFENSCRPRLLQQSALLTSFTVFQVGSIVCLFLSLFIISGVIISCYLIWCTFSRFKTRDEWPPVIRLKIHMGKLIKHFFCLLMKGKNLVNTQLSSQLWKESFKRKSCFEVRLSSIRHFERTKPAEKNANTRKTLWRNF